MRNLALQGEVRHILPRLPEGSYNDITTSGEDFTPRNIVAVIRNADADQHIGPDNFGDQYSDEFHGGGSENERSNRPAVSFVVTSEGILFALDSNDQLVWVMDLEKVAQDTSDEEEEDEVDGGHADADVPDSDCHHPRSWWFYTGSFLRENSPDNFCDDDADILGTNLAGGGGYHLTCLSHAGHVVSVSIDAAAVIASKGGIVEDGSECIGTFEKGLECGGWSPDGEVLALITFASDCDDEDRSEIANVNEPNAKVPILMTMNTQYEILSEVRLDPCLSPSHSNDSGNSIHPNAISLCWRPDSSSLAVSTMDADVNGKPLRRVRTYHRSTLQILSYSKEEDGSGRDVPNLLAVAPTWAPAGCSHYVGAVQSSRPMSAKRARARQVSLQVAFMEPNGLRHRECKIQGLFHEKADKEDVIWIAFNLEGDLLAVISTVTSHDKISSQQYQYGKVQLYHRSNYHWYLKYESRYDSISGSSPAVVSSVKFSDENPYQIMVALSGQGMQGALEWREYTFRWDSSTVHCGLTSVHAMVIDGRKLHSTLLNKAVIPPPMYASSLEFPAPVVGITARPCFHNETTMEGLVDFIIALSDGKLALLQSCAASKDGSSSTPGVQPLLVIAFIDPSNVNASCDAVDSDLPQQRMALRDITIIDVDGSSLTLAALSCPEAGCRKHNLVDTLVEMKISWNSRTDNVEVLADNEADITITSSLPLDGRALRIVNWSDTAYSPSARGTALLQLTDGTLLEYSQGGVVTACEAGTLLEPCPWIAGVYDGNIDAASTSSITDDGDDLQGHDHSSKRIVVGLSFRLRLYCGEWLLSRASSSFAISLHHKFVTHISMGSRPQLRFLPLASLRDFDPLMGFDENMALDGYEPRSIERGARLVAIFPLEPTLVVQMPRGNLETISPRALVLPYIMKKIQGGRFLVALEIMRRQRVDMNLIVDLDPSNFLEKGGAEQFIGQIEKIDNINLFLASLVDVDTTLWKYPVPSWIHDRQTANGLQATPSQNKLNTVCKKVRQVMLDAEKDGITSSGKIVEEGHFILPTLSTFAKENPPKLEEALALIKNSASTYSSKNPKRKSVLLSEHVQSLIQYLAFLADYEVIFNTAIGMYDFDLAKAVARHSQMDPKVYLPMLKRWRELPEATARYEVDVKLKRYESALRHLVAAVQVEDKTSGEAHFIKCLQFIEEHSLHKLGLELFKDDKASRRSIMVSHGERLLLKRKPEEALTVFLMSNPRDLDGGMRASQASGDWRTYFACCAQDGKKTIGSDQITAMAESISSKVCSMHEQRENYASAASILLDYGHNVIGAIDMLISGWWWSEGRRIAFLHNRNDLVKKVVDGSISYARICIENLADRASTFALTIKRYAEIIVIRRNAIREEEAVINDEHHDDSASTFSHASNASNASLRSSASGTSVGSVGSIGSVASISTVISVGATSKFSFTGNVDSMKHKSKFNKIGRDKKKKKRKKKKGARRIRPGSEEELNELVITLGHTCPDEHFVGVINETIIFLLQSDKQSMATLLFESYNELESVVAQSQTSRMEQDRLEREVREQKERKEGCTYEFIEHPCEKKINAIRCIPLQESVQNTLSFLL